MCVIAIKPAGVKRPPKDQLEAMCTANPDGFGYMTWSKKQGLQVRKTMDAEQFVKWVQKIPDRQPVVYHARIATHGSVNVRNSHPFLSDDKQWAFAHNGILRIQNERDMTDSETFFRRIAMPMLQAGYHPNDKGDFDAMVATIIDSSKFVFMDSDGNIYHYGVFIEDNGLLFSNASYRPYKERWTWRDYPQFHHGWDDAEDEVQDYTENDATFDALVERLSADMETDPEVWEKSTAELYDEYKANYPVSWNDFVAAFDFAQMFV